MEWLCFLLLLSAVSSALSSNLVTYGGDTPLLPLSFEEDGETYFAKIEINYESYFFLGPKCKKQSECSNLEIDEVYDPSEYTTSKLEPFAWKYIDNICTVTGEAYIGYLGSPLFTSGRAIIPVVEKIEVPTVLQHVGLMGMGFKNKLAVDNILKKIFEKYPTHQIIFRRGPFAHYLRNKNLSSTDVVGKYQLGEETLEGCGTFKYFKPMEHKGWKLDGAIQIGSKIYTKYEIMLEMDRTMDVPPEVYDEHFKGVTKEEDIPDFYFYPDEKTKYMISKEKLSQYPKKKFILDVFRNYSPSFVLGMNFLSQYCISLKADSKMENMEIGFADVIPLADDPQYTKIDNGGDDGDGGKSNEDDDSKDDDDNDDGKKGDGGEKGGKDGGDQGDKGDKGGEGGKEDDDDDNGKKSGKGDEDGSSKDKLSSLISQSIILIMAMLFVTVF